MAIAVGTDTYITIADATTYFKHSINGAAWTDASTGTKESALVSATRSLDRQKWQGSKYQEAPTQVLEFPRSGLFDKNGVAVDETTVPQEVIDANCEYALAMLDDADLANSEETSGNIKKLKAGSAEIEYFRGTRSARFSTVITELIGIWLTGASAYLGPFVSGAEHESAFSDTFDLTRGF